MQNIAKTRNDPGLHQQLVRHPPLSGRLRAGRQRESGCFPLHFRHFTLDYLFGAWYNKDVIPQTLHQQQRERA